MTGGQALEVFEDFVLTTGPANLTDANQMVNEATKETYILGRVMRGSMMHQMVQGGENIKDEMLFDEIRNFKNYKTNEKHNWKNPQVLTRWSVPWRFSMDHMSWTDQEIMLNNGDLSETARFRKYKDLKRTKEMNLWTGFMNGMEEQLWAVPDFSEMESTTGGTPFSFPVFINEFTDAAGNGLYPSWLSSATPAGPNTVQGINTLTEPKWDNQRLSYARAGDINAGSGTHLFSAMDKIWRQLRFARLPKRPDLSDPTTNPAFIAASNDGCSNYEDALRTSQNHLRYGGGMDPAYPYPKFHNTDLVYVSELDDAPIFPTPSATTLGTETASGTGNSGPRYFFINGYYLLKAVHRERYFFKKRPFSPSNQPWNHIMPVDIWHNNIVRSRRRQGIIYPSTDITVVA